MATHECSGCLQETIQGATEVDATLVLPNSICTAPGGGRHTWARKGDYLQTYLFHCARALDIGYIYIKFLIRACWAGASYSIFRISSPSQILNMIIYKAVVD